MPTYTMALKTVHELEDGKVGLDDYPIFDEKYRATLNQKILDHYWNQEIGQESISMWRFAMARKMNEIMPLYNQHYELSLLKIDPLSTVNIKSLVAAVTSEKGTTEGTAKGTGSNTTTSQSNGETASTESVAGHSENSSTSGAQSRAVASDTPQTALQVDADYATSMQDTNSGSTASGQADDTRETTGTGTNSDKSTADTKSVNDTTSAETMASQGTADSEQETTGYNGHAPQLILQARQALVNIDMMIIKELQDLFMLIWSNNDSYTERRSPYYGFFR